MQTPELDDSTTSQDTNIATAGNDGSTIIPTENVGSDHSTATENVMQESAGGGDENNTGDFIAVAFGILLLLITILVVAGIIAYMLRQKKKKGEILMYMYDLHTC